MTDENRFFRFLWRVNAILIVFAGVLAIGVLVFMTIESQSEFKPANFQLKPKPQDATYVYSIEGGNLSSTDSGAYSAIARMANQGASLLDGTHEAYLFLVRKPLGRNFGVGLGSMSYYSGVWAVNMVMLDTQTGKGRWLFSGTGRVIHSVTEVHSQFPVTGQANNPVKAMLLLVTDTDTNKDGSLTDDDRQSLYLYRPGDTGVAKILTGDKIISVDQADADTVLILYREGQNTRTAIFSTTNFQVHAQETLPAYVQ